MAITLDLPPDLQTRLTALADKVGRSASSVLCGAVAEYVADLEDYYLALERVQQSPERSVPLDEVVERLGLVDSL